MPCSLDRFPAVAAFLAGSPVRWSDLHIEEHALLAICATEDLSALCVHRLSRLPSNDDWPLSLRDTLSAAAHRQVGEELLRAAETRAVLGALANSGVSAILIKGTPLAYTVYDAPALRTRNDTDVLVAEPDVPAAQQVMASLGYATTVHCDDLFSQFEVQKTDRFGVLHVFDVHWKISTQPVFQSVLTYDEMLSRAALVPALGPHARAAGAVDALLLACIHPVMHHRNEERVLWMYDVHLLAERLSSDQFDEFAVLARGREVAAVCSHELSRAQSLFGTVVPPAVLARLARGGSGEPSADYLASQRRWHHELASSVRGTPRFGDRVKLLRNVLLPSPGYMLGVYGLRGKPLAAWLLPALYVHRNVRGAWKILTGKK